MTTRPPNKPPPPPDFAESAFPIGDTAWSGLDDAQRADYLRTANERALARHREIVSGQRAHAQVLEQHGTLLQAQARRLIRQEASLLDNTESTKRTEGKVDGLIERSDAVLDLLDDARASVRLIGKLGEWAKRVAWVVVPFAALAGAWHWTSAALERFWR